MTMGLGHKMHWLYAVAIHPAGSTVDDITRPYYIIYGSTYLRDTEDVISGDQLSGRNFLPLYVIYSACSSWPKRSKVHTLWSTRQYHQLLWRSAEQGICRACGHRLTRLQAFLRQILQMVRTCSSQFLSIKTYLVDNSESLRWETETMEFESGQTIPLSACSTLTKVPTVATELPLALYNRYFTFTHDNRTHPSLNRREDI